MHVFLPSYLCWELEYEFSKAEQEMMSHETNKLQKIKVFKVTWREEDQIISPVILKEKEKWWS